MENLQKHEVNVAFTKVR